MRRGLVVWFTGLPGSGKTTLARRVARRMPAPPVLLDSDALREAIAPRLGYGPKDRAEFYRALTNLAVLLAGQGLTVFVAATANRRAVRERARRLLARRFLEVYLDVPLEQVRQRDVKGLYRRRPAALPGVGVRYEPPRRPEVVAHGGRDEAAVEQVLRRCRGR